MKDKNSLYLEMLEISLPYIRNSLSGLILTGKKRFESYELAELVHKIPDLLRSDSINKQDLWFLNVQARSFYEKANKTFHYEKINSLISELFDIVPKNLESELEWKGPTPNDG